MKIFIAIAVLILLACSPESPALIDPVVNSYGGFTDDDPPADMPNVHLDPEAWEEWSRKNDSLYIKYLASLDSLSF